MAQLANLDEWLETMVMQGVLTLAEAWQMQDEQNLTPPDGERTLPESMWPIAQAIWLHELTEGLPMH